MDGKKVLEVAGIYRQYFERSRVGKRDYPYGSVVGLVLGLRSDVLFHCYSMLDRMEELVAEDRMSKAFRWLGFIQGCLWATGCYTLQELKDHSKPGPEDNKLNSTQDLESLSHYDLTDDWEY